jgi:hypothetical protein
MLDAASEKKKQVSLKKPASPTLNFRQPSGRLLVRNYNKLRALSTFYQQKGGFAGSASLYGGVELRHVGDGFTVYLDDDVTLLETGGRGSRIRVNIGDDYALRAFGSLELLTQVGRQGLD